MPIEDHAHPWCVDQVSHGLKGTLLSSRGVILERAVVAAVITTRGWWFPARSERGLHSTENAVVGNGGDGWSWDSWRYGDCVASSVCLVGVNRAQGVIYFRGKR